MEAVELPELPPWTDTPALVLDLDVALANVREMQALSTRHGKALVPHAKTHKLPFLGQLQLEAGAKGLTLAKLGEAEVFADYGLSPLFVANQVVGRARYERLAALARRAEVSVGVDDPTVAQALGEVLVAGGVEVQVLVEVDTGLGRAGLAEPEAVADLAKRVDGLPGLAFGGLFTHEGQVYRLTTPEEIRRATEEAARRLRRAVVAVEARGLACERVSMGSTPSARFAAPLEGINELRPGTYVFHDGNQVALGVAPVEACAAVVLATVTSRPTPKRVILDAGSKALSGDPPGPAAPGHGLVKGLPEARIARLYEEHAVVEVPADSGLRVGDRVAVVPTHVCPVFNLFDRVHVVQGGRYRVTWGVAARGRST